MALNVKDFLIEHKKPLLWIAGAHIVTIFFTVVLGTSLHQIDDQHVGLYYRHGKLLDRVGQPGLNMMLPIFDSCVRIKIEAQEYNITPIVAISKDGIANTFKDIQVMTSINEQNLLQMVHKYGCDFMQKLIHIRIHEHLRYGF